MEAKTRLLPLLGLLALLLLSGCVAQTQITNTWRDSAHAGVRFQKILVMGFGEDGANRRVFEDQFVQTLQAAGVSAVASYTLVSGLSDSDLPRVRDAVAKSGAEAVLTTRLLGVDKRVNVYPAQPVLMPAFGYRRGFSGYYSSVTMMPPSTYNYSVVTLETNLWHVPGESLVWSGTTETFAPEEARKTSAEFARIIVEALRGQGLL
jgi:hypothetical protein